MKTVKYLVEHPDEPYDVVFDDLEHAAGLGLKSGNPRAALGRPPHVMVQDYLGRVYDPAVAPPAPGFPRTRWVSIAFDTVVGSTGIYETRRVHQPFRAKYLLLTTPGFKIRCLDAGSYRILHDVDGDLYLVSEWDRLERESQLERVRLPGHTLSEREELRLDVVVRHAANLAPGAKIPFRAMVVGEELVQGPY